MQLDAIMLLDEVLPVEEGRATCKD